MERVTNIGIGKHELTKLFILNSAALVLSLALGACSQTDVERIREINESAVTTPTATVRPTMAVGQPSPVPVATIALPSPVPVATIALPSPVPVATVALPSPVPVATIALPSPVPVATIALPSPVPTATVTSERLSAEIQVIEVAEGDCINSALPEGISIETVEIVVCSGPWQYRVLGLFEVDSQDGYPEESFFASRAFENCDRRYSYLLIPLNESWMLGDRTVACLQESFGLSVVDPAKLDRLVGVNAVELGECYNEAPETGGVRVELVDCSGSWEYRVLGAFTVDDQERYPGQSFFESRAYENCGRRSSYFTYPLEESWMFGDRAVSCLQESFGLSVVAPAKLDRLVDINTLGPGECYNEAPETGWLLAELVNCTGPWQYRVLGTFEVADQDKYPGPSYFESRAFESCDRRYSYYLYPLEEHWKLGDRVVSCLQESFGLSVVDPAKLDRLVGLNTVEIGECFSETPKAGGILVELVDCSGPWEYRVLGLFRVDDQVDFPGESYFERLAYESCDRRYTLSLYPVPEYWILGDRAVSCLQESFGLSVTDPAKLDRLVSLETVNLGECYSEAPETGGIAVELVDCSGPWEFQVVKAFKVPWDREFPGTDYFEQQANKECGDTDYYFGPSSWIWDLGNRVVLCIKASNP